ncbi:gamma-glutamyltransferase [Thalassoroseus pseudoceratinae]|uniref:gamma-glutamyltransferase n=1 Tax=Thalassoroseus pseudoceratinae TaxID=2713176 RepID=UPI001F104469|nr:gamma-glutamyltransferase [Thalassoroseus pseudoceratinae]
MADQIVPRIAEFDRPAGPEFQGRSVVMGRNGMIATSHPWAAQVGLDILRSGGTAVDAAIAANAMLGVVEPMSCGIGGDLFAICWDQSTGQLHGLNASGRSPKSLDRSVFAKRGLEEIPFSGPLSWSVPGCVDGWEELRRRFGQKSLAEILAPPIETAEQGFAVSEIIASHWLTAEDSLAEWADSKRVYLPNGVAPKAGEVFRNSELASSYRAIAEHGRDAFYCGEIAGRIVQFSKENDGFLTATDLAEHQSEWVDPVSTNYRGYDVWELPPNGQGIAALEMLNLLSGFDVAAMGRRSADFVHLFIETKKLAFADRARFYADPAFAAVPIAELISQSYADAQRKRIDMTKAATDVPAGDPKISRGDTVYVTAVDKDRNCCSLIQSNYYGFGSKVVPGEVGFVLQNRGALFALDDTHPNRLEPGKRPFHTIIPAMVTRDGRPCFCFGVMGGDMQPQGHVQVLCNLLDFGLNVQAAGDATRVQHFGSATPTGQPQEPNGGRVAIENGISEEVRAELTRRGHELIESPGSFGGYQGIWIDWEKGVLHGGTESRKDGTAVGY